MQEKLCPCEAAGWPYYSCKQVEEGVVTLRLHLDRERKECSRPPTPPFSISKHYRETFLCQLPSYILGQQDNHH